jgi:phosphocarrier protein
VQAAAEQPVRVLVSIGDKKPVRADSMIAVLTLGATKGAVLTLYAEGGSDAEQTLDTLAALLEKDLDAS